jgi:two-component system phosphate regulon sensor histidine kinase PhoR
VLNSVNAIGKGRSKDVDLSMNRRIRSIFWLMTACIVGINAFQAYWLWKNYQIDRQQFSQTVQDALFQVLEQQQVGEARRLLGKKLQGSTALADSHSSRIIIRQYGSESQQTRVFFYDQPDSLSKTPKTGKQSTKRLIVTYNTNQQRTDNLPPLPADSIARRISSLVMLNWAGGKKLNLPKLKIDYRTELLRRSIDTDFQLDTITIHPRHGNSDVLIFKNDGQQSDSVNRLQTSPLPINPVQNLFVQASFTTPSFYLLRRMGWLLGGSLLLLLLTTGCFLFMLSTIMRQKKLSEVKNDFINNMTHELKTPIATVTAAIEALQNFGALNDPQRTQTYLAISQNNLQRLSDLVEKVLNLAVEEKRELTLRPESVNLAELAHDLITNHQLRAPKPVAFISDIPAETSVLVDRVHFGNALNNLIDNAINYSREQVHIRLAFRQNRDGWQLSVVDDGIGILKTYQSAIFDRFFRVPTGNLHTVKGFGLGLAYVRQVVERHGGHIQVQSEPGKGSEFILLFTNH